MTDQYQFETLSGLDKNQAMEYDRCSFPRLKDRWMSEDPKGPVTVVVSRANHELVGAAVAETAGNGASAELVSLFVSPKHRRKGIGGNLLGLIQDGLKAKGTKRLDLYYYSNWPAYEILEHMLVKNGWFPPENTLVLTRTNLERVAKHFPYNEVTLPEGYEIFSWDGLSADERDDIKKRQENESWYPSYVSPFQDQNRIEPLTSLGLRHQGKVIGWMITHRVAEDTINYTALFVSREHQKHVPAVALLSECFKRQSQAGIPDIVWVFDAKSQRVGKFMDSLTTEESKASRPTSYQRYSYKELVSQK